MKSDDLFLGTSVNAHAHCFKEVTTFFLGKISVLDPLRALEPPFQKS